MSAILPAVEQRIGTSSQPLDAGVNPAHIPGLTGPEKAAEPEPEDAAPVEEEATEEASDAVEPEAEEPEEPEAADGPVFEAADRRARIVADARGVRLSLDDESCEFRWDEIGAIETESPRFGKRFTVTVHTPDRRWYPIEIEAQSKSQHKEWDEQLDAVLDAYFETDGDDNAA
ncbi:hypothetical protein SSP24_34230 [Streptomyces spinoverrucosus]|uniref:Uncharacterized protein n=1 Tax=Streptomyces spinoverrucosus TaxID=284043 RepID=A0A4Y3VI30_9ACTN|nr:hypothetical protein [Streptomyces spinoverrucosus]GEC05768.1 hypothetical protein SSP24_34230 [Streptomyces spinoverrucosus]GHB82758.1 hypothetical protein GCM10010397_62470 [Streptomyces spinoverrucosus]